MNCNKSKRWVPIHLQTHAETTSLHWLDITWKTVWSIAHVLIHITIKATITKPHTQTHKRRFNSPSRSRGKYVSFSWTVWLFGCNTLTAVQTIQRCWNHFVLPNIDSVCLFVPPIDSSLYKKILFFVVVVVVSFLHALSQACANRSSVRSFIRKCSPLAYV